MTKEEAIKELAYYLVYWKRLKNEHIVPTNECENTINALRMAIEALNADWIPCSERLPEYREIVIISTFWGVKTGYLDSIEAYGDFWEIIEDDGTTALHNIYAWMPLPKPYKGGDAE